jgi:putative ATPase
MKDLNYGKGYKYAHDYAGAQVDQEHFPPNLQGRRYYEPTSHGFEAQIRERLAWREERAQGTGDRQQATGRVPALSSSSQPSAPTDPQALAGEESQDVGDDDGAQIRRPAASASKRAGKPGRGE